MGHETWHEPFESLSAETRDLHRAIISLIEELEAVDWYQQRAEGCADDALRAVLMHNRNEEIEHAMMTLEWIRRNEAVFDRNARGYLFRPGPITDSLSKATGPPPNDGGDHANPAAASNGSLGIGSLRG